MELTPEEKQRIQDEEKRTFAQEQYRAQVRAELQHGRRGKAIAKWAAGILAIVTVVAIAWRVAQSGQSDPNSTQRGAPAPSPSDRTDRRIRS